MTAHEVGAALMYQRNPDERGREIAARLNEVVARERPKYDTGRPVPTG